MPPTDTATKDLHHMSQDFPCGREGPIIND
jgi:hypothetical protein